MPFRKDDPQGIGIMLEKCLGEDADAATIATFAVSIWHEIEAALAPIFEESDVAAIYRRTLDLTAGLHPSLADAHECARSTGKFAGLAAALIEHEPEYGRAILASLLDTFHGLLSGIFGGTML